MRENPHVLRFLRLLDRLQVLTPRMHEMVVKHLIKAGYPDVAILLTALMIEMVEYGMLDNYSYGVAVLWPDGDYERVYRNLMQRIM